ncbi:SixA phosphatase family protein [Nocardioides marmoribigeumensis]|jgi:phosphohistidine phosphatase|uniref:Phosphohistidine phosphatase n=1 Tax=Nocardioides marmoribigeumensis TaxID=433649 RepID=A0ABU2BSI5_9ACTN|nr:histidine phosphatase family protein [Nocardioides marmoribigeumensis]MDR7361590.1 phosphohistidine phosphatase [Nocardioides marmoribigeumensis]
MAEPSQDRTLVLLRHAKSDWSVDACDADRPLNKRGKRQAAETGRWLARHVPVDLALVSTAKRAQQTWRRACEQMPSTAPCRDSAALYTHDGSEVLRVVRSLPDNARCVVLVGHNPALEEAVDRLTGTWVEMPTSALAVVRLAAWQDAGTTPGTLASHGRPPA